MSLKGSNKVDTNRYELEVSIDGESFRKAVEQAYRKNVKKMNVPGFRKGHAPQSILEKFYGENVFYEDALNILYPAAVDAAVAEAGLELVDDKLDFNLDSIGKDGVEFKITVTTKPEVTVENYKGLKAEKVLPAVSESEIDEEIDRLALRNSRMVTVADRAAQKDDIAVIDFEGFVDGVAFEGGKGESHSLTLGAGQFIPGFEEQVIGHHTGDEFEVNVEFPADYHAENLAGKPAVFKVKLHEIKVRELPAIDDEFAKDVSEFDTLAELRADFQAKLLENKTKEADDSVENQLIDQLVDEVKAEIPEVMFERKVNENLQDFDYRLQMQGMNLDTYMQYTGTSAEDFRKNFRPQAERQVKLRLALEKIAELESIVLTEEEIAAEYENLAKSYSVDVDKVKTAIPEKEVAKDLAVSRAIAFVKDHAEITEVEKKSDDTAKEAAEPPKKKTSRKKSAKNADEASASE